MYSVERAKEVIQREGQSVSKLGESALNPRLEETAVTAKVVGFGMKSTLPMAKKSWYISY